MHETLLLGSENALRTKEHAETQKVAIWRPSSWGPPHEEPFWATRQHSTTRGEVPFQTGGLAQILSLPGGQEGHLPGCLASPTEAGRGGGRPLLHETLLLGSRSALRTTEHAETQKIAIWRPRPGHPLTMSHFGPPDSVRRRVGRPLSRGGPDTRRFSAPARRAGRPFTRLSGLSHRGRESRRKAAFCTKRFC